MVAVERVRLAYNNVYFVSEGETLAVIDAGPDYRGAREALTAALRGRKPSVVVATHGHLDHAGLGAWWQEQGVPVLLGAADLPQAEGSSDSDIDAMESYVRTLGAPPEVEAEVVAGLELRRGWTARMRQAKDWPAARDGRWPTGLRYQTFTPKKLAGEEDPLSHANLRLVSAPGHTPGNLVVTWEKTADESVLFSGDQLLPEITPTPAIQFHGGQRFPSLPRFLESLEALRKREPLPSICYPGHGEPFENVAEVIDTNLEQARQRSERLREELKAGSASVYELAARMYPRALRRRFWQIISTIQGHLDGLAEAGLAVQRGGRWSV